MLIPTLRRWVSECLRSKFRRSPRRQKWSTRVTQGLEQRILLTAFSEFVDPNPSAGNGVGSWIVTLPNGNVVITSPNDDAGGIDAGEVYLFDGTTGA
jgi:hypothetical protein